MKLTLEIFQEPQTPNQWTARCVELDIISAHTLPEVAIEAIAEAVRMTLVYEMGLSHLSCTEAFEVIKARVTARRENSAAQVREVVAAVVEGAIQETTFTDDLKDTLVSALVDEIADRVAAQLAGQRVGVVGTETIAAMQDTAGGATIDWTENDGMRGAHAFGVRADGALIIYATLPDGSGERIRIEPQRVCAVLAACGDALARKPSTR
jgi:hypothetical protein